MRRAISLASPFPSQPPLTNACWHCLSIGSLQESQKRAFSTSSPFTPPPTKHGKQPSKYKSKKSAYYDPRVSRRPKPIATKANPLGDFDAAAHTSVRNPLSRGYTTATNPFSATPETYYNFFPLTLPSGPPPSSPFTIPLRSLRNEYLQLQSRAHPDLHSGPLKARAEALSSRINEAYKTLQDPLRRAVYLLGLRGVNVEGEGEGTTLGLRIDGDEEGEEEEKMLLMEVMEAREEIEEAESERELVGLRERNEERIAASVRVLEEAFARVEGEEGEGVKVVERARRETVRLRYWYNVRESIEGWTKSEGVPNLMH